MIRKILKELVFYHKDCISGRTTDSKEWNKLINSTIAQIKAEMVECVPKENRYAKGLANQICSLGIWGKDRRELKQCEKDRNIGFNACITETKANVERMFK